MNAPRCLLSPAQALPEALSADLDAWVAHGWLRELDRSFALFIAHHGHTRGAVSAPGDPPSPAPAPAPASPLLALAAALASHQLGRGHACLDLAAVLSDPQGTLALPPERQESRPAEPDAALAPPRPPATLLAGVDLKSWLAALDCPGRVGAGPGNTPLVLIGERLYLRRYWQYEQTVGQAIRGRLTDDGADRPFGPDEQALLQASLDVLFPRGHAVSPGTDWQKVACALAARSRFSIITGGPGTGKTTTVVRLLAVLQHLALSSGTRERLRIRMAAPTGKAAARLNESIAGALRRLPLEGLSDAEALRAAIPTEVTTVHRLLGSRPDTRRFRYGKDNPLPVDVLVIDEASMVDLEMMACVLEALPPQAQLVLLGDKDQLASVEAGAVLGDLCGRADAGHYTEGTRAWVRQVAGESIDDSLIDEGGRPLDQVIVKLRHSHRFGADSGIGRFASLVNAGQADDLPELRREELPDLAWLDATRDREALERLALDGACEAFAASGQGRVDQGQPVAPPVGHRHYLSTMQTSRPAAHDARTAWDAWARRVLAAYGQFQILCAVRQGPYGVDRMNERIARWLHGEGLIDGSQGWYEGRPVMVTRNDYALGLMNGDIGIALAVPSNPTQGDEAGSGRPAEAGKAAEGSSPTLLRVAFPAGEAGAGVRWVLPSRLQAHETVFAMTVHKSQGSEFTHAALVLPEQMSRVLTRELVYTGITRARHWFTVFSADTRQAILEQSVGRRVRRVGGLMGDS